MAVFFGEFSQAADKDAYLTGEQFLHHLTLPLLKDFAIGVGRSGKARINPFELVKTFSVDKHSIQKIQEVITRRTMRSPIGRQMFVSAEDLFNDDIASR
jgi:hypothetical protein